MVFTWAPSFLICSSFQIVTRMMSQTWEDAEILLTGWASETAMKRLTVCTGVQTGGCMDSKDLLHLPKSHKPSPEERIYKHNDPFPDVLAGEGVDIDGGVWRYHPTKDRFEVVAHGL